MNKKLFFMMLLVLILSSFLNASELRLNGMSGISKSGLYIVPDEWCDSFFINPAYLSITEKLFINANTKFNAEWATYKNDSFDSDNDRESSRLSLNPLNNFGMLVPINLFSFGFNINLYSSAYSYLDDYLNIYGDGDYSNSLYLTGDLLFSWEINKYLSLGVKHQIKSKLFYSNKDVDNGKVMDKTKVPVDFETNNNFGVLIKNKKIQASISIPFNFNYSEIDFFDYYHTIDNNYFDLFYYINNQYIKYSYKYRTGLNTLFDINVSEKILFRVPVEIGIEITNTKRLYEDKREAGDLNLNNNYYNLNRYYCPLKFAYFCKQ